MPILHQHMTQAAQLGLLARPGFDQRAVSAGECSQLIVRSQWRLSDIAVRDEAKEVRPDVRSQAQKNRRCIHWNALRIFSGRERRRW